MALTRINRDERGLTLIELLITISVLAVVSAIALPVINNVVTSSNSNALQQTIKDADAFIKKYSASGVVLYDGLKTLTGYVDTDGDNVIEAGEKMDSLTLDNKYAISVTGSAQLGGSYTNGGVTAATITPSASGSSANTVDGLTAFKNVFEVWFAQHEGTLYSSWGFSPGYLDNRANIYTYQGGSSAFNSQTTYYTTWSPEHPVAFHNAGDGYTAPYTYISVEDALERLANAPSAISGWSDANYQYTGTATSTGDMRAILISETTLATGQNTWNSGLYFINLTGPLFDPGTTSVPLN